MGKQVAEVWAESAETCWLGGPEQWITGKNRDGCNMWHTSPAAICGVPGRLSL